MSEKFLKAMEGKGMYLAAIARAEAAERERDEAVASRAQMHGVLHRILECYEEAAGGITEDYEMAYAALATPAPAALADLRARVLEEAAKKASGIPEVAAAIRAMKEDGE